MMLKIKVKKIEINFWASTLKFICYSGNKNTKSLKKSTFLLSGRDRACLCRQVIFLQSKTSVADQSYGITFLYILA